MTTTQLTPNNYRLHMATKFLESFEIGEDVYYVYAGQAPEFSGNIVPPIFDSVNTTQFGGWNTMLFGKHAQASDASLMIAANLWTSGTIYNMYDDQDPNLPIEPFFVYISEGGSYYVFKCLYNAGGAPSTSPPVFADTSASDTFYQTTDGYQWKYMFTIDSGTFSKFSTANFIPVVVDPNVTGNAVSGSIDVILVQGSGTGYNNYFVDTLAASSVTNTTTPTVVLANTASKTSNFYYGCYFYVTGGTGQGQYKQITGHAANSTETYITLDSPFSTVPDNTSTYEIMPSVVILNSTNTPATAAARALINSAASNSVSSIQILNRGAGVFHAGAYVYASPQVGVSNNATIRVVSAPKGGHGANVAAELYSSSVGISVTFSNSESNTISTNNGYRQAGLLKNPLFGNVTFTTSNATGAFIVGETIIQSSNVVGQSNGVVSSIAANTVVATDVSGFFGVNTAITGLTSGSSAYVNFINNNGTFKFFETFSQLYRYDGTYVTGSSFTEDEVVFQSNVAVSNAVFHSNNASGNSVYLTQKLGPITSSNTIIGQSSGAVFNINTNYNPDLIVKSGDILYVEDFDAVTRSPTQKETIQLILQF